MKIDLHTHTIYSDGSLSPKEIIDLAIKRKVKILSITDHDVVSALSSALKYSEGKDIEIITGIEISSKVRCSKEKIHMVGLYFNHKHKKIKELSNRKIKLRKIKIRKILRLVNNYFKTNITFNEIKAKTKGFPSVPHIAMVLLDKKLVKSIKEGIKALIKGGPCYLKQLYDEIYADEAIKIIHEAGGIAVLAHLSMYKYEDKFKTF